MSDYSSELSLPFAEYGKKFRPNQGATDFDWLDSSDNGIAARLHNFYNTQLAMYTVIKRMPFTTRAPGYGNFTSALMPDWDRSGNYLFIQLQQRQEQEPLLREHLPIGGLWSNRSYNQARLSVVTLAQLRDWFKQGGKTYTSLLVRSKAGSDSPCLNDYWEYDARTASQAVRYPVTYQAMPDTDLDPALLAGLINCLYQYFGPQARAKATAIKKTVPSVIFVASGRQELLDVEFRLRLMQAAQARLLPATGIISFTLDYISEPYFQFYFCAEPPPAWMFTDPILLSERDLALATQPALDYYHATQELSLEELYSPIMANYLSRVFPPADSVQIACTLMSENGPLPPNLADLVLNNLSRMPRNDVPAVISRAFRTERSLIADFFRESLVKLENAELRQALYKVLLDQALENLANDLASYFYYYSQISDTDRAIPELRKRFKEAVSSSMSASLDATHVEQASLFRELILRSTEDQLTFSDGTSARNVAFSKPGPALWFAIKTLREQNIWNEPMNRDLADASLGWTEDNRRELKQQTGIDLPDIFLPLLLRLLKNSQKLDELKKMPFEFLDRIIIHGTPGKQLSLLADKNAPQQLQLRSICKGLSLENLSFADKWLGELAGAGEDIFKQDYGDLIKQYKPASLPKTPDEQRVHFLLHGTAQGDIRSLHQACKVKLEGQYDVVLRIWVERKFAIPKDDIAMLVDRLPESKSNDLLVQLVANDDPQQIAEICGLSAEQALQWLKRTADTPLRERYKKNEEDKLYSRLCKITNATSEFTFYALAEDPSVPQPTSWPKYQDRLGSLYDEFKTHGGGGEAAATLVAMVKSFNCPSGEEEYHCYELRRLAKGDPIVINVEDREEPNPFLTYTLGEGIDPLIKERAQKVLLDEDNIDILLRNISHLTDDQVGALHLFYERNHADKRILDALETAGGSLRDKEEPLGEKASSVILPLPDAKQSPQFIWKRKRWNRYNIIGIIVMGIIVIGIVLAWILSGQQTATALALSQQQTVLALSQQQTATALALSQQQTVLALSQQRTATALALAQQQTANAAALQGQQTATSVALTSQALTKQAPTPTPTLTNCPATVSGSFSLMSPVPAMVYEANGATRAPGGSSVLVDGKLSDSIWFHVNFNGKFGWIRASDLKLKDSNCKPGIADLHFLAKWLDPNWRVLVDDSFVANQYPWSLRSDNSQIISSIDGEGEGYLAVSTMNQESIFSTPALRQAQVSDFNLYTYFTIQYTTGTEDTSYIGFRFYENNDSFYQIRFFPSAKCAYSIYENEKQVLTVNLKKSICADRYYTLMLSFNANHELRLSINGGDNGPIEVDVQCLSAKGGINLSARNLRVHYHYMVVTAPR